jgi:hypothetical protein
MSYINPELRRFVADRAGYCCEYCLLSQFDNFLPFEIDHITAEKHRGLTVERNLCLSCSYCNGYKGSDIASLDPQNDQLSRLFNPRTQKWSDHFRLNGAFIEPLTPEGRVTVFLLRMNDEMQVIERAGLIARGRYPCSPTE